MNIVFFNPQGNFDPLDSHLTEHPDFGGQLVYVKEVCLALAQLGARVDIVTRLVDDPDWPEYSQPVEFYNDAPGNPRIVRLPCGGSKFLPKESLWPHLGEFIENAVRFYADDPPDFATAHYADGGYCAVLFRRRMGIGFTFTGHSLGAQKLDKLGMSPENAAGMERRFHFSQRIAAERLAMTRAYRIITSTSQERREQYGHALYRGAVNVEDDARFAVIAPGVNTHIFHTDGGDQSGDDTLERLQRTRSGGEPLPSIIVSSRLDEKKNIVGTVKAYANNPRLRRRSRLVVCIRGITDPFQEIESLAPPEQRVLRSILKVITEAGIKDMVDYLDLRSQRALADAYRYFAGQGSVFALTAFYEPFGLAPIEAAACGLAVVATRNGGPTEIFADGSGVLVDPEDVDDIARGLNECLDRQPELARMARQRVLERYTWSRTATQYLALARQGADMKVEKGMPVRPLDADQRIQTYLQG
jgi:sucrose-phosphate synthase